MKFVVPLFFSQAVTNEPVSLGMLDGLGPAALKYMPFSRSPPTHGPVPVELSQHLLGDLFGVELACAGKFQYPYRDELNDEGRSDQLCPRGGHLQHPVHGFYLEKIRRGSERHRNHML